MKRIRGLVLSITLLLLLAGSVFADIKIRQKMTMSGQTFETTKMIKGARQRTEQKSGAGGAMDFMSQVATIEQCDLRRNVQLNDGKKLYFVQPFAQEGVTETTTPVKRPDAAQTKQGGTITMTYTVTDTGERQTLFGLPARHLKIVHETEMSPDSCSGARKSKMEIDGWFVDFSADFNCPIDVSQAARVQATKPDCKDRVIFKGNANAKTGFMLNGTMRMYDENGNVAMSQTTETLELSRSPLAASLFDVPADYKLVASSQELYSMPSTADFMKQQQQQQKNDDREENPRTPAETGAKSVGLNVVLGGDAGKANQSEISQYLQNKLRDNNLNVRIGTGTNGLVYVLNAEIKKVKESTAGKVGGLFGKVTGVDTKVGKTEVELVMTLTKADSNAVVSQIRIAQKFDGNTSEAVKTAIDEGLEKILAEIKDQ